MALISSASIAQDVKKKIDEQAKDPRTKENAAKADVFIQNKHIIADSSVQYKPASTVTKKSATTTKKKKAKRCSSKTTK